MKVSVVIPTFKRAETLSRALHSVRQQGHENWEAVVVDDGDGSGLAAALALGDNRIRAFENEGRGQVAARNTALRHARGDAIALLDDDDWWEDSEHLARSVAALQEQPALVYRPCWLVYETGGLETHRKLYDLPASASSLRENNTLIASSVVYPRAFHGELGPFDEGVGSYWDWFLRVTGAGYGLRRACATASGRTAPPPCPTLPRKSRTSRRSGPSTGSLSSSKTTPCCFQSRVKGRLVRLSVAQSHEHTFMNLRESRCQKIT